MKYFLSYIFFTSIIYICKCQNIKTYEYPENIKLVDTLFFNSEKLVCHYRKRFISSDFKYAYKKVNKFPLKLANPSRRFNKGDLITINNFYLHKRGLKLIASNKNCFLLVYMVGGREYGPVCLIMHKLSKLNIEYTEIPIDDITYILESKDRLEYTKAIFQSLNRFAMSKHIN